MNNLSPLALGLFLTLTISCKKEPTPETSFFDCTGKSDPPAVILDCSGFINGSLLFCKTTHVGDFELDEQSKRFMPQYCKQLNDVLEFQHANGESFVFKVLEKTYRQQHLIYNTGETCPDDTSNYSGVCIGSEVLRLTMRSDTPALTLTIELATKPDVLDKTNGKVGDYLSVFRWTSATSYYVDFEAVASQRTLPYATLPLHEFYPELTLLGKTYKNVISRDISLFSNKPYKIYVNQEVGLIGFENKPGNLWVLKT
ncbi:MAG: hypothetical protein IPM36_04855 [Lewinellaceae bacterium]|jgi:hypothetical protein|nr:hypothetical protein [Lewinellaceae bacterium]